MRKNKQGKEGEDSPHKDPENMECNVGTNVDENRQNRGGIQQHETTRVAFTPKLEYVFRQQSFG
jgi:hypothetical protein